LCSYISMPANTEVINLLRVFLGEADGDLPDDRFAGLTDRHLFETILRPGERSATFESSSHIQREYGADRICYFYVLVPSRFGQAEIGRVEIPLWVADDDALVNLIHAVILNECEKGEGYPIILSEAHEHAVIKAREKDQFYEMIEREMVKRGVPFTASNKRDSKRRPLV